MIENTQPIKKNIKPALLWPPLPSVESTKAIHAILKSRKIDCLTHFTRLENLAGILSFGLLTPTELRANPMTHATICNEPKLSSIWENSIRFNLAFPDYRLFYQMQKQQGHEWVVLLFDAEIMLLQPFCFFPMPAHLMLHRPDFQQRILPQLQTEIAFDSLFDSLPTIKREFLQIPDAYPTNPQAELTTFQPVPIQYLREIHFYNDYKFSQWCLQNPALSTTVDPNLWQVGLSYFSPRIDYPHWKTSFSRKLP